jgi:hypothetical protein
VALGSMVRDSGIALTERAELAGHDLGS